MSDALVRNRYFDALAATPGLMWMGQNTNHVPAHPTVQDALHAAVDGLEFNAYAPPLGFEALRAAIVQDLGLPQAEAVVTEGGVNALAMVVRARCRPGSRFVTTDPTWKWPCLFARQAGAEVVEIPIYDPACQYRLTPEALAREVDERTTIIYIVDPNNPLGIRYTAEEIAAFAAIAKASGALLVHDCTYRDFAETHVPALRVAPDNSVVSVSFSKWLGLAGLRIGALVMPASLLDEFAGRSSSVLGASVLAQRAAMAGLAVKDEWMRQVRQLDAGNKLLVKQAAEALGFRLPVWPSHGNFLVIEPGELRPEALVESARRRGIMIRQGSYHTARFGHRFIKVSTSVPAAWAVRLAELLPEITAEARKLNDVAPQF